MTRDIVVVGSGASGTYAAINLRDMNKSVVVVERNGRLGGQAETYIDPSTGIAVDYGVQFYHNDSFTRQFFARLNTPIANATFGSTAPPVFADFTAETLVTNYT